MNPPAFHRASHRKQKPGVIFPPQTHESFQRGIHHLVAAIRPSLGPIPRAVAIERDNRRASPELLQSGGIIARRIVELPNRDENMGTMFLRGVLWNLHEQTGDGVATAAVIFQAVYDHGLKYIRAGGNAMLLRQHLHTGMQHILQAIEAQSIPLQTDEMLIGAARTLCPDPELAAELSQIFAIIGPHGILEIRTGRRHKIERSFIAGSYWPGGVAAKPMLADPLRARSDLYNAAILLSDLEVDDPQAFAPVLRAATEADLRKVVIVARRFSEPMLGMFYQSKGSPKLELLAVKTPTGLPAEQMAHLQDLALLTGAEPLLQAAGDTFRQITADHFGQARHIWANEEYLGLIGGQGEPRALRTHVAKLRAAEQNAADLEESRPLQQRIGRLSGGAAALEIGGYTESEIETRKALAERTAAALRGILQSGALPGGGAALRACRPTLEAQRAQSTTPDERAAYEILLAAIEAPFEALLQNAGYHPGAIRARLTGSPPTFGFDLRRGEARDMAAAGILDSTRVQREAIQRAIRSAGLALTLDILVHRKKLPVALHPDEPGK